jgi:hypothetical protein
MQFLNPIWLWGLTGLLIPIGIHLLSRKEGRTIKVGSIRHLEDSATRQFKSIHLNEYLLLAIRSLLITLLVFLLSDFVFNGVDENKKWLLIEKGLEDDDKFGVLIDTLHKSGFEIRSLAEGFPNLSDSLNFEEKTDYWLLVQDLQTKGVDQAVVLSYSYVKRFKGRRIPLPENLQWISKSPEVNEFTLSTTQISEDSVAVKVGETNASQTSFKEIRSAINAQQNTFSSSLERIQRPDTISIAIVYDPAFRYDKDIITAAFHAIDKSIISVVTMKDYLASEFSANNKSDWTIWLSEKTAAGLTGNVIHYQHTSRDKDLFEPEVNSTRDNFWILTKRLNEEIALRKNLSVQLALILTQNPEDKGKVNDFDQRTLPDLLLWSKRSSAATTYKATMSAASSEKILTIAFLIVLLLERWLSFKRKQ